jgi:hypothetical protein
MNFFDSLMSPLGKNFCLYFYVVGLFFLGLVILSLGSVVFALVNGKSAYITFAGIILFLYILFGYTVTRLQYSICLATLK